MKARLSYGPLPDGTLAIRTEMDLEPERWYNLCMSVKWSPLPEGDAFSFDKVAVLETDTGKVLMLFESERSFSERARYVGLEKDPR